jgi:hypothetical protein
MTQLLCGFQLGPDAGSGAENLVEGSRPTGNRLRSMPTGSYPLPGSTAPDAAPAVAGAAFMLVRPLVLGLSSGPETLALMSLKLLGSSYCSLVLAELDHLLPLG